MTTSEARAAEVIGLFLRVFTDKSPRLTHKEFVRQFRVPEHTGQSFNFGKISACAGYRKLSFQEFFTNDVEVRISQVTRQSLYMAYMRGREKGQEIRERALARLEE